MERKRERTIATHYSDQHGSNSGNRRSYRDLVCFDKMALRVQLTIVQGGRRLVTLILNFRTRLAVVAFVEESHSRTRSLLSKGIIEIEALEAS